MTETRGIGPRQPVVTAKPKPLAPSAAATSTGMPPAVLPPKPDSVFEGTATGGTVVTPKAPSTMSTPAALVGRAGPTPPATPRFTLKDAVSDPTFTSKDPAVLPVPQALLDVIRGAKSVLLIGHIGPDGDCVGTNLAMQRALKDLGVKADVCVDDTLTGSLRTVDSEGQVRRAKDLQGGSWDLALIMDVGVPDRIGGALELLKQAKGVAVVDHHKVKPQAEDFGLRADQGFTAWVEEDFPCAALQAGAILAKLRPDLEAAGHNSTQSMLAALTGFATDTGWGTFQGLDKEKFRFFKNMLVDQAGLQISDVEKALQYDLPAAVTDALATGDGLKKTILSGPVAGSPARQGLGVLAIEEARVDELLDLGHKTDPRLVDMDITNVLKWGAVKDLGKVHRLGVFLIEKGGDVFVSVRGEGQGDLAHRLATALGGGGHAVAAGARVKGATVAEVEQRIVAWCRQEGIVP